MGGAVGRVRPLHRQAEPVGRPQLRLVHPDPDPRDQLRGLRPLRAAGADRLGVRHRLHDVRRAVPDGRRLHAVAQRPCPRRRGLPHLVAADPGQGRSGALHPVLFPGDAGADVRRLDLRRAVLAVPGGQRLEPGQHPDLPDEDADPDRRAVPVPAGRGRGLPLPRVHPRRPLAARLHDVEELESAILHAQEDEARAQAAGGVR